jgi:hypothetical protein
MLGHVLVLAFAAALYPTLLAAVVLILTRPDPKRRLAAFLCGGMVVSIAAGIGILAALNGSGASSSGTRKSFSPAVDLLVGVLSLACAALLWRRRTRALAAAPVAVPAPAPADEEDSPSWLNRRMASDSLLPVVAAAVVLNLPGAWYLAALKDIADAHHSTATEVVLVVVFNVIMFSLAEIPLVGYLVAPERTSREVARFDSWLRAHMRDIAIAIASVIGLYLVVKGLAALL